MQCGRALSPLGAALAALLSSPLLGEHRLDGDEHTERGDGRGANPPAYQQFSESQRRVLRGARARAYQRSDTPAQVRSQVGGLIGPRDSDFCGICKEEYWWVDRGAVEDGGE